MQTKPNYVVIDKRCYLMLMKNKFDVDIYYQKKKLISLLSSNVLNMRQNFLTDIKLCNYSTYNLYLRRKLFLY